MERLQFQRLHRSRQQEPFWFSKDFGYQHTTTKESNDRYIDVAPEYNDLYAAVQRMWDTKKKLMGASWQAGYVTNKRISVNQ